MVQRGHHFAIVDEVDSILIDEARTPLIISGPAEASTDLYYEVDTHHPQAEEGRGPSGPGQDRGSRSARGLRRLHRRREAQDGDADRGGHGQGRAAPRASPRGGRPLRPRQHAAAPPRPAGAARARPLPARRRVHDQGRPGRHRRRVHRPADARAPLERRPAPGGRGQGRREDRAREPDARDHHLPELLPQVQEALRHDRHGRDRGARVRQDLQPRRQRHPDQPAADAHRGARPRLSHRRREVERDRRGHHRASRTRAGRCWSARSRSKSPSGSRAC